MTFRRTFSGFPYAAAPSLLQLGLSVVLACASLSIGWVLTPFLGAFGAYFPLLISVAVVTWFGGLWPSLLLQVLGVGSILLLTNRLTDTFILTSDLYAALLFLVIAKLVMFLLLSIRFNRSLQQSTTHLEMIAQSTHDTLWEWDLMTDRIWRGGNTFEVSSAERKKHKPGFDWRELIHPDDKERVRSGLQRAINNGEQYWSEEYRLQREDGTVATISDHGFIIRNKKGVAIRMIGGMADISAQRAAEQVLAHQPSHDALTGLPNRAFLVNHLTRLMQKSRYKDDGSLLSILAIDLDRFKAINDSLGRIAGNQLLIAVAPRLTRCLRPKDILARLSGDKFAVLLNGIESTCEAVHIAERVQQSLLAPFQVDSNTISISASIGISFGDSVQIEELLRQADLAMYQAKAQGRGNYRIFEPAIETRTRFMLQSEAEFRRSFGDGSLQLHYQPIISLQNGKVFGFEALLRWYRPEHGLVKSLEILSIAEEAGLLSHLEQWVLESSCYCLGRWKKECVAASDLVMSFNLSGKELARPSLLKETETFLRKAGITGNSLIIELTETSIMQEDHAVSRNLSGFADLGIRLAIDDFGKGYSSLSRLQDLPVSILKIDDLFVSRIGTSRPEILEAIVSLAQKMKLEIIAEGVQTGEQLVYLREHGVELAQGFYFSEVLPAEDASRLLREDPFWSARKMESVGSTLTNGVVN